MFGVCCQLYLKAKEKKKQKESAEIILHPSLSH